MKHPNFEMLLQDMQGDLITEEGIRILYATDASVYRELPVAVAFPRDTRDIQLLVDFATRQGTSLIPRGAGTSLAGQVVGGGIVVDITRYMNQIIEFNQQDRWVKVQPGIVRDHLNHFLKPFGLFFSPITSTANRATIGGMVGNNSCGTNSIVYGTTRDKVLQLDVVLSTGQLATFGSLSSDAFCSQAYQPSATSHLYHQISLDLNRADTRANIKEYFPKPQIHRRNTGYAVDALLHSTAFDDNTSEDFNFCKLLCGSEGTLAFTTAVTISLDLLPPPCEVVVVAHFTSIIDSMRATQVAMRHQPTACELMDKIILNCTKENIEQQKNRKPINGDPAAILMIEFRGNTEEQATSKALQLIRDFKDAHLGYDYPMVYPPETSGLWSLRSAGLGVLANIPGDSKAVACIEDTAVAIEDLADYIADFQSLMKEFQQEAVYYAHAGAGEIHLRPILNLKKSADRQAFYDISLASAKLVKKYKGSLSGEHGDGRVRAPFIKMIVGDENYDLFMRIKKNWDPNNIFNPGKIVNAAPMSESLRYEADVHIPPIETMLDFSAERGILRAAEKCNGSGDCRKLPLSGGTMCPSYHVTKSEKDSTRGRANTLREFLTKSSNINRFDHIEIKEAMDLCLSCKGCTSECPSNVDMSSLKAEFLHQYYQSNKIPLRARAFAHIDTLNRLGSIAPKLYNLLLQNKYSSALAKSILRVAPQRNLPTIHPISLRQWYHNNYQPHSSHRSDLKRVYLFCDEFTNWNDTPIGIKGILLLQALGYHVILIDHPESGRAALSKGLLPYAQKVANANIRLFADKISGDTPLVGIEPSAILSFRDEYPRLVSHKWVEDAHHIKTHAYTIDEFLAAEIQKGHISSDAFTSDEIHIVLHGHCHQKALSNISMTAWILSLPKNYSVEVLPTGCCGMAGSFGYEAEHYELSQQVGELVLFPAIRKAAARSIICASGTSCRHQILEGTSRQALHPVEVLWEALLK